MYKCTEVILYLQYLSNSFPDSDGSAMNEETDGLYSLALYL